MNIGRICGSKYEVNIARLDIMHLKTTMNGICLMTVNTENISDAYNFLKQEPTLEV